MIEIKRFFVFFLTLCFLLATACSADRGDPNVYDVEYGGKIYTVNHNNQTITFDGHVCRYEVSGNRMNLIYPDGSTYWWTTSGNVGYGGWSDDYDENRYVSGDTLWDVLEQERPNDRNNSSHWFFGLLLAGVGVFQIASPKTSWWLSHGWRFKDAEPSDLALGLGRAGGVVLIIIGIICFFV